MMKYIVILFALVIGFTTSGCKKRRFLKCRIHYADVDTRFIPPVHYSQINSEYGEVSIIRNEVEFLSVFPDTTLVSNIDWTQKTIIGTTVYESCESKTQGSSLCVNHKKERYKLSVFINPYCGRRGPVVEHAWFIIPKENDSYYIEFRKSVEY